MVCDHRKGLITERGSLINENNSSQRREGTFLSTESARATPSLEKKMESEAPLAYGSPGAPDSIFFSISFYNKNNDRKNNQK